MWGGEIIIAFDTIRYCEVLALRLGVIRYAQVLVLGIKISPLGGIQGAAALLM